MSSKSGKATTSRKATSRKATSSKATSSKATSRKATSSKATSSKATSSKATSSKATRTSPQKKLFTKDEVIILIEKEIRKVDDSWKDIVAPLEDELKKYISENFKLNKIVNDFYARNAPQ